jgi:hypothetical protein
MIRSYKSQPLKVALLVLLLAVVAIVGSYMLYNRPAHDETSVTPSTAVRWQIYITHNKHLSFRYPERWSVSEADVAGASDSKTIYISSPDGKTTLNIIDNVNPPNARVTGDILASEPTRLFGAASFWNYIQADVPASSETGSKPTSTIQANLMTTSGMDATWPALPDGSTGKGVAISIQNFAASTNAPQMHKIPDVITARRIAESLALANGVTAQ